MELKINNLKDNDKILWKKIPCCCKQGNTAKSFPITTCLHCQYQKCEDSLPRESFIIKDVDVEGNIKKIKVKEITIVRGSHDDIIGWSF